MKLRLPSFLLLPRGGPRSGVLLGLLLKYLGGSTDWSRYRLARALGCCTRTLDRYLADLVDLGVVERQRDRLVVTEDGRMAWEAWSVRGCERLDVSTAALPWAARRVHAQLRRQLQRRDGFVPSVRSMAADLGLACSTVQQAVARLRNAGLVVELGRTKKKVGSYWIRLWNRCAVTSPLPAGLRSKTWSFPRKNEYTPQTSSEKTAAAELQPRQEPPRQTVPRPRGPNSLASLLPGVLIPILAT